MLSFYTCTVRIITTMGTVSALLKLTLTEGHALKAAL